jgi:hypothetical protein
MFSKIKNYTWLLYRTYLPGELLVAFKWYKLIVMILRLWETLEPKVDFVTYSLMIILLPMLLT